MLIDKKEFTTVSELKERGWTDKLIRDILGEPDSSRPNPYYRSAAPMRLYRLARVEAVENSEQWASILQRAERGKISAKAAVQTKRDKLLAHLQSLELVVPRLPTDTLIREACGHYNRRQEEREKWDYVIATPTSDSAFLSRITVNYLRHELSHYEHELEKVFGKVGVRDAYIEINRKVYDAIAEAYPDFSEECSRQLDTKIERYQMHVHRPQAQDPQN